MTLVFLVGQSSAALHLPRRGAGQGPGASACSDSHQSGMALLACLSHPTNNWAFSPQARVMGKIRLSNIYTPHLTFTSSASTGIQLTCTTVQPHSSLPTDKPVNFILQGVRPFVQRGDFNIRHAVNLQVTYSLNSQLETSWVSSSSFYRGKTEADKSTTLTQRCFAE